MSSKNLTMMMVALMCAVSMAAPRGSRQRGAIGADGGEATAKGRDAYVTIDTPARPGGQCISEVPNLSAKGKLMPPLGGRPRQWIVLETKYTTMAKWQDELTFTWHVLLDSTKAKEKDPKNPVSQYSYYNATVRYVDIKKGSHMASVCLPPSALERFGEPCTITLVITNKEGDILASDTQNADSNVSKAGAKWWENDEFMNWKDRKRDMAMVERRQGMVDRSKTPFWLVNNADYEQVQ